MQQQADGSETNDDRMQVGPGGPYTSPDALLRDADGHNGPEARAIATGYTMALRDAEADCLSAATLLGYLRCEAGSELHLRGLGYVMAVRDSMAWAGGARARAPSACDAAGTRSDAIRVRTWLEQQPESVIQPAIASVQVALSASRPAASACASLLRAPAQAFQWLGAWLRPSRALAVLALGLAFVMVLRPAVSDDEARRTRQDFMASRQADNLMTMLLQQRRYEKDSILTLSDPDRSGAYAQKWKDTRIALMEAVDVLGSLDLPEEDRRSLAQIRSDLGSYEQGYLQLLSQMREGRVRTPQDANKVLADYKPAAHRVEANGILIAARALRRAQLR